MPQFKQKEISIIQAEQFLPPSEIPIGVIDAHQDLDGNWFGYVLTIQGELVKVKSTEWIVQELENRNRYYPIQNEVFCRKYESVR
jgi:hypothetical protein